MKYFKKIKYNSPVILTYTFLSLIVLILGQMTNHYTTRLLFSVYHSSLFDPLFYIRIFAHIFGHIDFEHYFSNFFIILLIGPMLEEKYGSRNMLVLIFITAIILGIFQTIISKDILLGASGIAFMLIVLSSFANFESGKISLTTVIIVFLYLGKEIYYGITIQDDISQFTHILGGICGLFLGIFINKFLKQKE